MNRVLWVLLVLPGCGWDFERMLDQPYAEPFEASTLFADGMVMRHPPEGTVHRSQELGPPAVLYGHVNEEAVVEVPVNVDRALLERGRNRYQVFCAPCHGLRGDSRSQVAENMTLRPPPVLVEPPIRGYPAGRVYRAIREGYGFMRSYAAELSVRDRWAVVAYIQALQLSQRVALEELPESLRKEAGSWL